MSLSHLIRLHFRQRQAFFLSSGRSALFAYFEFNILYLHFKVSWLDDLLVLFFAFTRHLTLYLFNLVAVELGLGVVRFVPITSFHLFTVVRVLIGCLLERNLWFRPESLLVVHTFWFVSAQHGRSLCSKA